jgi:hypothetical protein
MGAWVWIVIGVAVLAAVAIPAVRRWGQQRDPGVPKPIPPVDIVQVPSEEDDPTENGRAPDELHIRPLGTLARVRYTTQWSHLEQRFADVPEAAVADADELITEVLQECGFPVDDFDAKADLVSIEHPDVVHNYRTAHWICIKTLDGQGGSAEELETAARSYRALFDELVGADGTRS